jgi:two-component system sensor histidine kinase CiaH
MNIPYINFEPARTRLALTYLSIIMVLSLGFSYAFYQQSLSEARFGFSRQESQLRDYLYFTTPEGVEHIRNTQLAAFRVNLLKRLTALNLGMLAVGGALSYILAKRSLRPLEDTIAAQSRFTSDAAHELRTPLTAMKTEIEVAVRDKSLKMPEAKEILRSNLEEVNKLETLTAALLRLARSSQQIDETHWQTYKLHDILQEAVKRVQAKATAKKINLQLKPSQLTVHGDSDQLVELFVILLDNAIKYSPNKSKVILSTTQKDGTVKIKVQDEGIGINQLDLPHIFERFYRADQSRTHSSANGYGLGLSLAETIAQAHHGKITVNSTPGMGSIFSVQLPSP